MWRACAPSPATELRVRGIYDQTMSTPTTDRSGLIPLALVPARSDQRVSERPQLDAEVRKSLERRAKMLAWVGNGWHLIEFSIALAAGIAAGLCRAARLRSRQPDRGCRCRRRDLAVQRRTRLIARGGASRAAVIAASYGLLVAYITVAAMRDLLGAHHPAVSWVGIGLAAFAAATMPLLARLKRDVGRRLSSSATISGGGPEHDLRLSLDRASCRLATECARGLVVGRPARGACDCGGRCTGGRRELARRALRVLLIARIARRI